MSEPLIEEHFFRREYAKLVATLSRRVGVQHIEAVEDAVQSALMTALQTWPRSGLPDRPTAWLFRVAYNELVGELRTQTTRSRLLEVRASSEAPVSVPESEPHFENEIGDDLLRMLFVCCDGAIPVPSQLALALKVLCGFGVPEIAHRLFASEANVYKRLIRARTRLREAPQWPGSHDSEDIATRLPAVRTILYLLFTEGYMSYHADFGIREELCDEAIRLATLLAEHRAGSDAETHALLALMHLHAARMTARNDGSGGLLLLEEQDRSLWDKDRIAVGLSWLAKSATGSAFSRFHAEAGIAAEHCLAPSFAETRWDRIVDCYTLLEETSPSPIHSLNRAVAVAEQLGPAAGLEILQGAEPPAWLEKSFLWSAVLADLHQRCGNVEKAERFRAIAFDSAPNEAVGTLLQRRLSS